MASYQNKPKDGSEEGRYTEKHEEAVLNELKKDGVILELDVHNRLIGNGWNSDLNDRFARIERNIPLMQRLKKFTEHLSLRDDSTLGEIDIVSEKAFRVKYNPFLGSHLHLIIECKTRFDENWVLLVKENVLHGSPDAKSFGCFSTSESSIFGFFGEMYEKRFDFWGKKIHCAFGGASHHCNSKLTHVAETGWGLFKNRNSLYDAVRHVLDALDYYELKQCFLTDLAIHSLDKGEKFLGLAHWRIYLVIIIDGALWGLEYIDGKPNVYPLEIGVLDYVHQNRRYYVDIVRLDAFEKYLGILQQEIEDVIKISQD